MFPLPRGATGFSRPEHGPLPETDAPRRPVPSPSPLDRLRRGAADLNTSGFSRAEWHQISCFGITTLGGVLFNAWD